MHNKTFDITAKSMTRFQSTETMEVGQELVSSSHPTLLSKSIPAKKIWVDIDNSPHVPFFLPIIEELQARGFDVLLTARDMYQVCELLEYYKLPCKVIGGHWGKNKILKVLVNVKRVLNLLPTAGRFRPDLALSHGSRAQVLACKLLNIPSVMMHDYEHSVKTGFLEPDWTFMPDVMPDGCMRKQLDRTLKYPGIKEDVYVPRFQPDPSIFNILGISPEHLIITLRPPATEAHYHNPESEELFAETLRLLADKPNVRAVTLPRNAAQAKVLQKQWPDLIASGRMIIPKSPLDGLNLIWFSDLVVSGGGTMNREAAALGVPVYSIFRGKIGAVDQYLVENGRLTLLESIEDVRTKILLRRRNRSAKPENTGRPALESIIEKIVSILNEQTA